MPRHTTPIPIILVSPPNLLETVVPRIVTERLPDFPVSKIMWVNPPDQIITMELLRDWLYTLSFRLGPAEKRVYILPQIDAAQTEVSHALLKTLEEPPEQTQIILTCRDVNSLLPTLISRCLVISPPESLSEQSETIKLGSPDTELRQNTAQEIAQKIWQNLNPQGQLYDLFSQLPKTLTLTQALEIVHTLIDLCLPQRQTKTGREKLKVLMTATGQLKVNAHIRLTLENCLLQIYLLTKGAKMAPIPQKIK